MNFCVKNTYMSRTLTDVFSNEKEDHVLLVCSGDNAFFEYVEFTREEILMMLPVIIDFIDIPENKLLEASEDSGK